LVLVSLISTAAALAVERAWDHERTARRQEERATIEASDNFAMARDAVNRLLSELAKGRLAALPEEVRRRLAVDAAEFNERFLRMRPHDPVLRRDAARIFLEAGNIDRSLGRVTEAVAAYTRSVAVLEQLAQEFPNEMRYRDQLAETLHEAADLLHRDGRPASAEQFCRQGLALAEHLLDQAPNSTAFRRTKATCVNSLAEILVDMGRYADAFDAGQQSLAIWGPLAKADGATYLDEIVFGIFLKDQGRVLQQAGRSREAEPLLLQAIERLGALADGPLDPKRLGKLAENVIRSNATFILRLAQTELGLALSAEPGRRSDAKGALDAAVDGLTKLGAGTSSNAGHRKALALAYLARGSLRSTPGEAEADWVEARKMLEKLAAEFPHNATYQGPLALVLGRLGHLALDKGDRTAARPLLEEAVRHEKQALEANPDSPPDRRNHARLLDELDALGGSAQH
jgi:tetratricopeptide (TPR) repeat protein